MAIVNKYPNLIDEVPAEGTTSPSMEVAISSPKMSRRETRDYDSKRHRSRFDREPSPKRSRRDRKEVSERIHNDSDARTDHKDQELKLCMPCEAPVVSDIKEEPLAVSKEAAKRTDDVIDSDKKLNRSKETDKKASDQKSMPSERSYFQHDERASTRQVERNSRGRTTSGRGWWKDSKDHYDGREVRNESRSRDIQHRDDRPKKSRENDGRVWRHDGFFEMEADPSLPPPPPLPERKHSAFTEKKLQADPESVEKTQTDHTMHERREERGKHNDHYWDRSERPFARDRIPANRGEERRLSTSGDHIYGRGGGGGSGSNYRGRERNIGRSGYNPTSRVDKWKHDMFHEANRSPTPKKEEDNIAKVEALLAS